jgi:hypothetical protein
MADAGLFREESTARWWLVCSERKVLLADKPSEQDVELNGPNKKWRNDERTAFQICVR